MNSSDNIYQNMQFNHIILQQIPEHSDYDQLRKAQQLLIKSGISRILPDSRIKVTLFEGSERLINNYYNLLSQFPELLV